MSAPPAAPKVSVVVPVYNERSTIEQILLRIQEVDLEKEIVVVDDGSTDGTRDFLKQLALHAMPNPGAMMLPQTQLTLQAGNLRVFFQDRNRGKGAALRRAFQEAKGEIVIVQDADLEYDPNDYFRLLEPIERGYADVVYGSRFLGGGPHRVLFFWHYVGNKVLTIASNVVTNLNLSDVWTCYKAFRRNALAGIHLREDRFGFEQEITAKIARSGLRIYEVPISYFGRTYAEGKKITWKDGFRGIWCVLRYGLFG
jgi:glycosyltransferase involved in cell wall biosynthesis